MTESGDKKLSPTDRASELLLSRVAENTIYDHVFTIATEVGLDEPQISRIRADFLGFTNIQILHVSVQLTLNIRCTLAFSRKSSSPH